MLEVCKKVKRLILSVYFMAALVWPLFARNPVPSFEVKTDINRIEIFMTIPDGFRQGWQPRFFGVDAVESDHFSVSEVIFPEGFGEGDYLSGTVKISILLNAFQSGQADIPVTVRYQLCDSEGACFMPDRVRLSANVTLSAGETGFSGKTDAAEPANGTDTAGPAAGWILLFAFLGGLLLNIMPCVLPVLSLKAFGLLQQAGSRRKQLFVNAMLYSAGIIVSLLLLAIVTIAVRAGGRSVGWGFQFQSLGYLVFLIVLLVSVSFAMFDVLVVSFPGGVRTHSRKNMYAESFFTGILAVLLATPCTAPLLGAAVGFALTKSAVMILAVFFLIGLGLAFPFLLIGVIPGAVRLLPKPGSWMNVVKEVTGFILCGVALWLLSVLGGQVGVTALIRFSGWLLLLVFSFRIWKEYVVMGGSRRVRALSVILILILLVPTAFILFPTERVEKAAEESVFASYSPFSEEAVAAAVANGEPVFVVFSADWCLTCQTNEKTVLSDSEINRLLREEGVRLFYGDYTAGDEAIARYLRRYGRAGVPFALFIDRNGKETVLPELLTKNQIKGLLNQ